MNWLPHEYVVIFWVALGPCIVAGLSLFFSGFFGEAGKDAWQLLKRKLLLKTPEPIEVERDYHVLGYAPGMCEWVPEVVLHDRKDAGYTYYMHPVRHAPCFRFSDHSRKVREYLMVKPQ